MSLLRVALALSGGAALAATQLPDGPLRVAVTTVFLCVCPGLAAARWARPAVAARTTGRIVVLETGVLAVMLSMSLATVVAGGLFLADAFTATRALLALAVLTCALALLPRR